MNIKEALAHRDVFASAIRDPATLTWLAFLSGALCFANVERRPSYSAPAPAARPFPPSPSMRRGCAAGAAPARLHDGPMCCLLRRVPRLQRLSHARRAITIMVLAADRKQARVIMRYVRGLLKLPVFAKLVERESAESFDLSNRVTIEVHTASTKTVRGYAIPVALCDEIAFIVEQRLCRGALNYRAWRMFAIRLLPMQRRRG